MRRLVLVLLIGVLMAVSNGAVAGAAKPSAADGVQGTYTYHDGGWAITVGYIGPGHTFVWGTDPYANYYAKLAKLKSSTSITRHAAWKLDASMFEIFGLHLSPEAYHVLANDAATIACA